MNTKEIRFHGRGGLGVALTTQMVVAAFGIDGKYAAGLPSFGVERRGSPVAGFIRVSDKPIREKCRVYCPDCLVVMHAPQLAQSQTFEGLKPNAMLLLDAVEMLPEKPDENVKTIAVVDATRIAIEELKRPITNTCMLGALAGATGWLKLDSVTTALEQYFKGDVLQANRRCVERGFHELEMKEW
ncbi:2-oxoacid:acceptor oxidoreductase family protein [Thermodesulfobacteriota bacterium]